MLAFTCRIKTNKLERAWKLCLFNFLSPFSATVSHTLYSPYFLIVTCTLCCFVRFYWYMGQWLGIFNDRNFYDWVVGRSVKKFPLACCSCWQFNISLRKLFVLSHYWNFLDPFRSSCWNIFVNFCCAPMRLIFFLLPDETCFLYSSLQCCLLGR